MNRVKHPQVSLLDFFLRHFDAGRLLGELPESTCFVSTRARSLGSCEDTENASCPSCSAKIRLFLRNNIETALQTFVSERANFRPGKPRGLRPEDVLLSCSENASMSLTSFFPGPWELGAPTITQTYDDAVVLEQPSCLGTGFAACTHKTKLSLPLLQRPRALQEGGERTRRYPGCPSSCSLPTSCRSQPRRAARSTAALGDHGTRQVADPRVRAPLQSTRTSSETRDQHVVSSLQCRRRVRDPPSRADGASSWNASPSSSFISSQETVPSMIAWRRNSGDFLPFRTVIMPNSVTLCESGWCRP